MFKNSNHVFHSSEDEQIMQANKAKLVNPTVFDVTNGDQKNLLSQALKKLSRWRIGKKKIVLHISPAEEVDFLLQNTEHATRNYTHLHLSAPECYEKFGSFAQMNPPIREKYHQDRLWQAVKNNEVSILALSCTSTKEENESMPSPSGIPGVQTIFHDANCTVG